MKEFEQFLLTDVKELSRLATLQQKLLDKFIRVDLETREDNPRIIQFNEYEQLAKFIGSSFPFAQGYKLGLIGQMIFQPKDEMSVDYRESYISSCLNQDDEIDEDVLFGNEVGSLQGVLFSNNLKKISKALFMVGIGFEPKLFLPNLKMLKQHGVANNFEEVGLKGFEKRAFSEDETKLFLHAYVSGLNDSGLYITDSNFKLESALNTLFKQNDKLKGSDKDKLFDENGELSYLKKGILGLEKILEEFKLTEKSSQSEIDRISFYLNNLKLSNEYFSQIFAFKTALKNFLNSDEEEEGDVQKAKDLASAFKNQIDKNFLGNEDNKVFFQIPEKSIELLGRIEDLVVKGETIELKLLLNKIVDLQIQEIKTKHLSEKDFLKKLFKPFVAAEARFSDNLAKIYDEEPMFDLNDALYSNSILAYETKRNIAQKVALEELALTMDKNPLEMSEQEKFLSDKADALLSDSENVGMYFLAKSTDKIH